MIRLKFLCVCSLLSVTLVGLPGCGNENITLPDVPPVQIPEAREPEVDPVTGQPRAGESSGMNFNPGGLNN